MKVGDRVLYLSEMGGQPSLRVVTVKEIVLAGDGKAVYDYDIVFTEELVGYVSYTDLLTKEQVLAMFDEVHNE